MIYYEILKAFFDYICQKFCLEKEIRDFSDFTKLHS